jgi:hypothetical protein
MYLYVKSSCPLASLVIVLTSLIEPCIGYPICQDLPKAANQSPVFEVRPSQDVNRETKASNSANPRVGDTKKSTLGSAKNEPFSSPRQKKALAMSFIEEALEAARRIEPIEYGILVQAEAAGVVHRFDKSRSDLILRNAVARLRELLARDAESAKGIDRSRQKLRFQVLRKIAAINPVLLSELSVKSTNNEMRPTISGNWTEEARALISVALDQIENDPKLAARLAEQSMALGYSDWQSFLTKLGRRDNNEAERLAIVLMNNLRSSELSAVMLTNLKGFMLSPDRSPKLQAYFFQSLLMRLRRDLQPDTPIECLAEDLLVAQQASQLSPVSLNDLQSEFLSTASAFEKMLIDRSATVPPEPRRRMIDVSLLLPATPGDTQEIESALPQVARIPDSQSRDSEYRKLAERAASKANVGLANEILSKISDDAMRQATTVTVYSPLVRKALADSNWSEAQKHAANILDPLGRTLAIDAIAQAMLRSGEEKLAVISLYRFAFDQLVRDWRTEQVAKALLIVAKSLYPLDSEAGIAATKSAVFVLNRLTTDDGGTQEATIGPAVTSWLSISNHSLRADEVLDTSELLGAVLRETAKHDLETALLASNELSHRGLSALARLAISKLLLEQATATAKKIRL